MSSSITSKLFLNGIELQVRLGWPEEERAQKQSVFIDIEIGFATLPEGCNTDELTDTICYADLIDQLNRDIANKSFRLLEYLTAEIYHFIVKNFSVAKCMVHVTKYPHISNLQNGVRFSYGELI